MISSLSALSLGSATLSPTFAANKHSYTTTIAKASAAAEDVTLSFTTANTSDVVHAIVDGSAIELTASGASYTGTVTLPAGAGGVVTILVDTRAGHAPVGRYYITVAYSYTA